MEINEKLSEILDCYSTMYFETYKKYKNTNDDVDEFLKSADELKKLTIDDILKTVEIDKYLRIISDLENQKKRYLKEKEEIIKYSSEKTIVEFLTILNDIEIAKENSIDSEGFNIIYNKLNNIIKNLGVEKIDCLGKDFNPDFHDAIYTVESDDKNKITKIIENGYSLKGKIIKHAKVIVSN